MKGPRILGWLVIAVMSVLMANILVNDSMDHGVGFDVFNAGAGNPWQLFINNDLVTGLLFMSGWILFREKGGRIIDRICWVWMVMWWGNIVVAAYVLRAAWQAQGDWLRFFLGTRAGALRARKIPGGARILSVALAVIVAGWTVWTIAATGYAAIPTIGCVLGFVPVVLTFLLLAMPADTEER